MTLANASNVSIGTYANTSGTNKTITNNIAGPNGLTIGAIELGTAAYTLSLGGTGITTVTGLIGGAANLTKADAGTLILSGTANTYTGVLQINNGTVQVASLADSGAGSNGTGAIKILNSNQAAATLRYVGPAVTVTRAIDIFAAGTGLGTATIESSGTGALTLSGNVVRSASAAATTKAFALAGTNTDANTVSGVISDGAGPLNVVKNGVGNWSLSNANTYTGSTTINAGKLTQANAAAFGTSNVFSVINGGVLDASLAGVTIGSGGSLTAGRTSGFATDVFGNVAITGGCAERLTADDQCRDVYAGRESVADQLDRPLQPEQRQHRRRRRERLGRRRRRGSRQPDAGRHDQRRTDRVERPLVRGQLHAISILRPVDRRRGQFRPADRTDARPLDLFVRHHHHAGQRVAGRHRQRGQLDLDRQRHDERLEQVDRRRLHRRDAGICSSTATS
ncbi:MAG: autotransporter-associated beta strand repeat-containing protein [Pirellulales bacterium]